MQIPIIKLPHYPAETALPAYATPGASGMDLHAAVAETVCIGPVPVLIPCGFKIAVPRGYEAQVRCRSGLALKFGISMVNGIGTIDSDYRGEVGVILWRPAAKIVDFPIRRGDRIAQLVIAPVTSVTWMPLPAEAFNALNSERGEGGFGSTGV